MGNLKTAGAAWLAGALLLGVLALATACSDSTSPQRPGVLTGTVRDQDGQPVAGASILISFYPTFEDVMQPQKARADLPPDSDLDWFKVVDACGDTIRTLCDGDCSLAGVIAWDGLDDQGRRALEGLYTYALAVNDTVTTGQVVMIHFYDGWDPAADRAHARTDAEGNYRLDDGCLGFGATITVTDELGDVVDERSLSRVVDVRVLAPGGARARRDSVVFPESGQLRLDFTLYPAQP
jgi:hypothetical protein